MKRIGLFLWLVFRTLSSLAQGEANHILANDFGFFKLINGDLTPVLHNGFIAHAHYFQNAIVMSDCEGVLLYYFSRLNLMNRNHEVMENGDSIAALNTSINIGGGGGHETIKKPGSDSLYYYFSTRIQIPTSSNSSNIEVTYALINMSANGGLGRVESKGNLIRNNVSQGITLVRHANKIWYWLLIYDPNLAQIHAYLINTTGINYRHSTPLQVVDTTGLLGAFLMPSPKGDKLFLLTNRQGQMPIHLFKFNNGTGQLFNQLTLAVTGFVSNGQKVLSEAFSPLGTKLYLKLDYPYNP